MRWQLLLWLSSMGEQKNPISLIYKAKRKKKEEKKKKSFLKKMKLKHGGEKSTTRKGKKDSKMRDIETDVMGGGAATRYGRDKREKETLASWLLNMRLFYSEAGIEWKCNKYIDIVFRGYLVALAPMSGSIGGSRLSCLGAWWWPVTGSLSDEWLC